MIGQYRKMTFSGNEVGDSVGDVLGQVNAPGRRGLSIGQPMPNVDGQADLGQIKAPTAVYTKDAPARWRQCLATMLHASQRRSVQ